MKPFIIGLISLLTVINNYAVTLSGIVQSADNQAVTNALVMSEMDNSIWTKTDAQGNFSLNGNAGHTYRVAALGFATKFSVSLSSGTANAIQLEIDPLLLKDAFHISFDHLRPGDFYSVDELKKDFTIAYGSGFYDGTPESNRAYVDKTESIDPNGTSLRVKFPKDKLKTSESGVDTRIYLSGNYKKANDFQEDELYVSYWVKYNTGFNHRCGGKMPSLGGEFVNTLDNSNERWKGRIMWRNGGSIQFYPELPHGEDKFEHDSLRFWGDKEFDGGDICTNKFTPYLSDGEWHNIELHYKLDHGTPTGVFEGWVDGGKGYKIINSSVFGFYRPQNQGYDNLTMNFIMLSTFFGGSGEEYYPEKDEYAWFDEFRVSKTRINEYEKYADNLITGTQTTPKTVIEAFPNPSSNGLFQLSTSTAWEVYSLQGVLLHAEEGTEINLTSEKAGFYLLKTNANTQYIIIK